MTQSDPALPQGARELMEHYALTLHAELQQLDSNYQSRIADATWPENIDLLKQYCLERFDDRAQALLFTSISSDTGSINPLYEQYLDMAEEKTLEFISVVLQKFPSLKEDVTSWVTLKLSSRKLHWLAHATREHLKSHPVPVVDLRGMAERQALGNLSKPEEAMNLPELPRRFQDAFVAEKARRELEYATRSERYPNQQQFAGDALHGLLQIQNVFFAFCTQARNACRDGDWTVAQASQAIDAAWPIICDAYFVRELGESSPEAKSVFRVALWRTVTDDPHWKQHLNELAALAEKASVTPPGGSDGEKHRVTDWGDIEIWFLSEERVQIHSGPSIETRNYSELGFEDRRNGKPNQAWVTLRVLAQENGIIRDAANTGSQWPKVEKRMQEIRKVLRKHFSITADPVPFVKGTGYRAKFTIRCSPSFQA